MTDTTIDKPKGAKSHEGGEDKTPPAALVAFATNLRKYRAVHRLSQENVADMTGLNQQVISAIERCDVNPTIKTLSVITDALGVSLPKFITPDEDYK